ncbi:MAG: hypothetical protein Q4E86_05880 [Lachnospiraceae bacterium]|nr:hypothetical protein [Lachnospiraceae bacterium]
MKRGYMDWDKSLLPLSALEQRRALLLGAAKRAGVKAVIIYGDVYSADELSYYVNYAPYWCNSAAVLTENDSYMVTGHNNRVNPWISTLTGMEQEKLLASGFKVPERTAQSLKERFPEGGRIGMIGKYAMAAMADALAKEGFELVVMDAEEAELLQHADAAYRATAAKAAEILRQAFKQGREDYANGGSSRTVTAEIEYSARKNGAMDIVLYVAYEGEAFGLPEVREDANGTWSVCALMQYLGVWVRMTETFGVDLTALRAELAAATAGLVPGRISAASQGARITVSQVLSDAVSDLNAKVERLTDGQVVSVEACDAANGIFCGEMYQISEKGAVAL